MEFKMKQKTKLIIILAAEFIAISIVLLLIFFAGKKSYTVTFDLNGGILLSGDLEQRVTQGQNAYPPSTAKEGHYLMGWAGSYTKVTRDVTVRAIWEYVTSPGIEYSDSTNMNYCEIVGSFAELHGEIYVGAYHDNKIVLGIVDGAFKDRKGITAMHLLDGIISIGAHSFEGCEKLASIDIPATTKVIGENAFAGCKSLKSITLPEGLERIEAGAFSGCEALEEIIIPRSVVYIGEGAFDTEGLTVYIYPDEVEEDTPSDDETDEDNDKDTDADVDDDTSPDQQVPVIREFVDGWHTESVKVEYVKKDGDSDSEDDDSQDEH